MYWARGFLVDALTCVHDRPQLENQRRLKERYADAADSIETVVRTRMHAFSLQRSVRGPDA